MNKKILLLVLLVLLTFTGFSQFKFGFKGGMNYNYAGKLLEGGSNIISSENKAGFHFGIWSRIKFVGFAIRPEVVYTQLKNQYQLQSSPNTNLKTKKIDIPVLLDKKYGPLHIFLGPSFQYILTSKFNSSDVSNAEFNKFTLGTQVGLGLEFGNIAFDARWEKGFSNNLTAILIQSTTNISLDNRPNQVILSFSYNLL